MPTSTLYVYLDSMAALLPRVNYSALLAEQAPQQLGWCSLLVKPDCLEDSLHPTVVDLNGKQPNTILLFKYNNCASNKARWIKSWYVYLGDSGQGCLCRSTGHQAVTYIKSYSDNLACCMTNNSFQFKSRTGQWRYIFWYDMQAVHCQLFCTCV